MEIVILAAVLGWAGFSLVRANTALGAETVRAYVYLGSLVAGASAEEAQLAAELDVVGAPTSIVRGAVACVKEDYAGRQSVMIAEAYSRGMRPKVPIWYRALMVRNAARQRSPSTGNTWAIAPKTDTDTRA